MQATVIHVMADAAVSVHVIVSLLPARLLAHVWWRDPNHLGAIVSMVTEQARDPAFYRKRLTRFHSLSHVTIEVRGPRSPQNITEQKGPELGHIFGLA
jgi:Co/Zn/Cd efflux system component